MGAWWSSLRGTHDWSTGYQPASSNSQGTLHFLGKARKERGHTAAVRPASTGFAAKLPAFLGGRGSSSTIVGNGNASKKRKDFRKLVESKKIVIGAPIKETFQHLEHGGPEAVLITLPPNTKNILELSL